MKYVLRLEYHGQMLEQAEFEATYDEMIKMLRIINSKQQLDAHVVDVVFPDARASGSKDALKVTVDSKQ